jgi:hypothetical protein
MDRLKFSREKDNAKLDKMKEWLPMDKPIVYTISLLSGFTCPSADECRTFAITDRKTGRRKVLDGKGAKFRCFSAIQEAQYPGVYNQREYNMDLLTSRWVKDRYKENVIEMTDLIKNSIPRPADIIRVHVGGDFFKKEYMEAWFHAAKMNKDIQFYAYTKSVKWMQELEHLRPNNFSMNASRGGRQDYIIDEFGMKSAEVVYHPSETTLPIDHNERYAIEDKGSFALLLHGTQKSGSEASKALIRMNKEGIEYSYSK